MTRREFSGAAAAVTAASSSAASAAPAASGRAIFELRHFGLRNTVDNQVQRTSAFLEKVWMPAMTRAGARPAGFFSSVIGSGAPFVMALTSYPTPGGYDAAIEKMENDGEYQSGLQAAYAKGPLYTRMETWLLRAFPSMPQIEIPPGDSQRAARVFELRTYESPDMSTLKRKVGMFDNGEIDLFRKVGMAPVFFGEMLAGPRMPNLVYMIGFDSMAARDKAWSAFGTHPDWLKMRALPGLADYEVVTNISNAILRPLPFSMVR
jgi:hypothetical protein